MKYAAHLFHAGVSWSRIFDLIAGLLVRSSISFLSCLRDDVMLVFGGEDPFIIDILVHGGTWDNTCKINVVYSRCSCSDFRLPLFQAFLLWHNHLS